MSAVQPRYVDASGEPELRPRSRRVVATARGAHRVLLVLALVGSVHALFLLGVETWRFVGERRAVAHLQGQVEDLQGQAQRLRQVIDHGDDPVYREELARRQGFMYPDEQRAVTQQPPSTSTP